MSVLVAILLWSIVGFVVMSLAVWFDIDDGEIEDSGLFFMSVWFWPFMLVFYAFKYAVYPILVWCVYNTNKWFKFIRNPNAK